MVTYHTHAQIVQMYADLCAARPEWCSSEVVGQTHLGNNITLFKIGNPNGGRILFDGCMHGWEDMGAELGYLFLVWLLESGDPAALWILQRCQWLMIPVVNYDSNGRTNMHIVCNPDYCQNGEFGVDLNRNFIRGWGLTSCKIGATQAECEANGGNWWNGHCCTGYPNNYHGGSAASEPETQVLRNVMNIYKPTAPQKAVYINTHYGGGPHIWYQASNDTAHQTWWTPIRNKVIQAWTDAGILFTNPNFSLGSYLPVNPQGVVGGGQAPGDGYAYGYEAFAWETCNRGCINGHQHNPCDTTPCGPTNPPYSLVTDCLYPVAHPFFVAISEAVAIETTGEYYVSTTGNDNNPGTFSLPFLTIGKAATVVAEGDTVYVRAGTYYEEVIVQGKHGTADNWITFTHYANEEVIVDGTNIGNGWGHGVFKPIDSSYIRITGFKIQNSARVGIWVNEPAHHIIMDNNEIHYCSGCGVYTETTHLPSEGTLTNIVFSHNIVDFVNNNWSGAGGDSSEGISFRNVQYFSIDNNTVSRCGKECIDAKHGSAYGEIHHNVVDTSSVPGGYNENYGHLGIYCDGFNERNHHIDIYSNYVYGSHGAGIIVGVEENTGSLDNVRVFNNIIDISWASGIGLGIVNWGTITGEPISDIHVFNNTVRTIAHNPFVIGADNLIGNILIENNIFVTETGYTGLRIWNYTPSDPKITLNNNLFYRYNGTIHNLWIDQWDVSWGNNPVIGNPLFISDTDFHLQSASPAIDTGITVDLAVDYDGHLRPSGTGYDIGAYEHTASLGPVDDSISFTIAIQ